MEDLTLFQVRKQAFLKKFLKRKSGVHLPPISSQNTLMLGGKGGGGGEREEGSTGNLWGNAWCRVYVSSQRKARNTQRTPRKQIHSEKFVITEVFLFYNGALSILIVTGKCFSFLPR